MTMTTSAVRMSDLAALLARADEQDRAESRQIEAAADHAAMQEEEERVAQLEAKASADECQGLSEGIGDIAGGLCTLGSAFVPSPATAGGAGGDAGFHWGTALGSGGTIFQGTGKAVAAGFKAAADGADANAARFDAEAQADVRRYDEAHEATQAADQSLEKVEQFVEQIQQADDASRLAAATYRA